MMVFMISGCTMLGFQKQTQDKTQQNATPVKVIHAERPSGVPDLLKYAERLNNEPAAQQQREYQEVQARYQENGDPRDLLRMALLQVFVEAARQDDEQIQTQLHSFVEQHKGSTSRDDKEITVLASLLLNALNGREQLQQRNSALNQQLEELNQQIDNLSQKLNELKAIEQKLNERDTLEMIQVPQ